jgi:mono/diheme cytochrome c family protein
MKTKNIQRLTLISLVFGLAACGGGEADQSNPPAETAMMEQQLPEGVTSAMVEEGKGIYSGAGRCVSCHGQTGRGIPNMGNDLTDDEWLHADGSYSSIVQSIMNGVSAEESSTGMAMLAKGGSEISEEQVRAVAAYVWTLSN